MIPESLIRRRRRPFPFSLEDDELPPGVAPFNPNARILNPRVPAARPMPAELSLPEFGGVEIAPPNYGRAPLVTGGGTIRPRRLPALPGEELDAERQYSSALQSFEPQTESKKMTALRIGLGLLSGGIPGAIAPLLDRKALDRGFQQRELAGSQQRLGQYRAQRREGLEDELLGARIEETRAQAQERLRPRQPKLVEQVQPDGTSILVPEAQGVVTGRPKALPQKVQVTVDGRTLDVDPEAALNYFGQIGTRNEKSRESEFASGQIQANIREASAERDRIGAFLKDIPPTITTPGIKYSDGSQDPPKVEPNPEHKDMMNRYRELDDNIRKWRTEIKPGRPASLPSNDPLKGKQWSKSRYRGSKPVDVAAREAAARGAVVID